MSVNENLLETKEFKLLFNLLEKAEQILSIINLSDSSISKYNTLKKLTFEMLNLEFKPLEKRYIKSNIPSPSSLSNNNNKNSKKEKIAVVIIFFGILLFILVVTGIIPVTTALAVILQLFSNLAHAGKGVFLTVFTLCLGFMSLTFSYTCTRLEYEEKDLG